MNKFQIIFIFSIFAAGSVCLQVPATAYFFAEDDEEQEIYRNEDFVLLEEEPGAGQFYALVPRDGYYKYVKYNAYYNQVFPITNFFELGDAEPQLSTIDPEGRRFFFTTDDGFKSTLYVIGLETGEIIRAYTFEYRIAMMQYDTETERIIGIGQNRHGNNKAIIIDTYNGALSRAADLSTIHRLKFDTAFLHPERREVWVIAEKRRVEYLMTVHADTGRPNIVKVLQVGPDDWIFYNFNTDKLNQILFAAGTKDSIILAGFNKQYLTTFIVHLTIHSTNVKKVIDEVQKKLNKVSADGLSDYDLTIVSGRAVENFIAFSKAQVLEDSLKRNFGVEEIERKEFFLGQPYNVVSSVNGVGVY